MSKVCKSRLKKDGSHRKTKTKHSHNSSLSNNDTADVGATRILNGHESKGVQIQDLGCNDVPELPHCSQEPLLYSSQDIGSQHEVRWDYQSPETVKKLKKRRGQYSSDDVRNIVENFSATQAKSEDPSLNPLRLHLTSKEELPHARLGIFQKDKAKVTRKYKKRHHNENSVQQMIQFLYDQTIKPDTDYKKECKRLSKSPNCNLNEGSNKSFSASSKNISDGDEICWSDEDDTFLIEATQNPEKFLNETQNLFAVPKHCISERARAGKALLTDSFVIPPSCSSKKSSIMGIKTAANVPYSSASSSSLSPKSVARTLKKMNNLQGTELYNNCTSAKNVTNGPSSKRFSRIESTQISLERLKQQCSTDSTLDGGFTSEPVSAAAFKSNSLHCSKFTNVKQCVPQNSQSIIVNPLPEATYKTSFRKINSFQNDSSSAGIRNNSDRSKGNQNSNLNSSFRRTLSFDSSFSLKRNSDRLCGTNNIPVPNFSEHLANSKSTSTATNIISGHNDTAKSELVGLNFQSVKVQNLNAAQDDGFDVSLPDDVFETLLEVDEILSSQSDISQSLISVVVTTTTDILPSICDKKTSPHVALGTNSGGSDKVSCNSRVKIDALASNTSLGVSTIENGVASCDTADVTFKKKGNYICDIPESRSKQLFSGKLSEMLPSPVRSVASLQIKKGSTNSPTHAYFNKTFSLKRASPRLHKTEKFLQPSLPSSSTPVKHAKNGAVQCAEDRTAAIVEDSSASFLESIFDDSFTNDVALFESQILPALEQVEAEAMSTKTGLSCSVKCSFKEIEQKRQIALQKRSIKLSQSSQVNKASELK